MVSFGKCLGIFKTTCIFECNFSIVKFMKCRHRSNISNENVVSKLKCAITTKHKQNFRHNINRTSQ